MFMGILAPHEAYRSSASKHIENTYSKDLCFD